MQMHRSNSPRRVAAIVLVVAAAVTPSLAGCSSDDDTATSTTTTTAPEEKVSTDAEVASGLATMRTLAGEIAAAVPDTARASEAADQLEVAWQAIEGTVKQNEPDLYVDIEDSLSLLSSAVEGDEEKAPLGVTDIEASIASYLEKHPA